MRSASRYSQSIEPRSASCASHGQRRPVGGLGQPRPAGLVPAWLKPKAACRAGPGQWHATAVPSRVDAAGPEVHRVLDLVGRQVGDLVEAQLVALVDVQRSRQRGGEQRRGPGSSAPEVDVGGRPLALGEERERAVLATVPGDRPGHVMVGQDPGGRGADRRVRGDASARSTRAGSPRPRAGS